ncbi:hypothetical protein BOVMAS34_13870 [Streptococcus uberis]
MSMILFRTIELGKNRKDIMTKIGYVKEPSGGIEKKIILEDNSI